MEILQVSLCISLKAKLRTGWHEICYIIHLHVAVSCHLHIHVTDVGAAASVEPSTRKRNSSFTPSLKNSDSRGHEIYIKMI